MPQGTDTQVQNNNAAPALTDEFLADLDANPHKMSELPRATRDAIKARRIAESADDGIADAAGETAPEPKTPVAEPVKADPPAEVPKKSPEELRRMQKAEADEANRLEQKLEAARKRREKADAALKEFDGIKPENKPADFLEDNHQEDVLTRLTKLEKRNEFLESTLRDRDQEEIETLTRSHKVTEEARQYNEVETLQADDKFAAIRMKKPFAKANEEYAGWLDNLAQLSGVKEDALSADEKKDPTNALRARALDRYENDPEFKASVKVQPPEELEKLYLILEGMHRKNSKGGNLKGHLFEILDEKGILGDVVQRNRQEAAHTAANKTAEAMNKKTTELQTIAPDDGIHRPIETDKELTPQSAATLMRAIRAKQDRGERLSAEEKDSLKKIRTYVANLQEQ